MPDIPARTEPADTRRNRGAFTKRKAQWYQAQAQVRYTRENYQWAQAQLAEAQENYRQALLALEKAGAPGEG